MERTHTCGALTGKEKGSTVTLQGWVATRRDHGGVVFIDLRDRYGITQVVFNPGSKIFAIAEKLRREDCIKISGNVRIRPEGMQNKNIGTGEIEVDGEGLTVYNRAETPPFEIDERTAVHEDLSLRFRYLDLRRASLQRNMLLRHNIVKATRNFLAAQQFLEIETPVLAKSTPEGARDYLVPSRVHPGTFYALPQSPQLFKQLLMISGFDRYYQMFLDNLLTS